MKKKKDKTKTFFTNNILDSAPILFILFIILSDSEDSEYFQIYLLFFFFPPQWIIPTEYCKIGNKIIGYDFFFFLSHTYVLLSL